MTVLILAPLADEHAAAVRAEIARRGDDCQIVDLEAFPERASLRMCFEPPGARSAEICVDGCTVDLRDVRGVWWRRPHHPAVAEGMVLPSHRAFAANEMHEALGGLWHSLDAHWVNEPAADDRAQRKGYQLAVAQDIGLEIPPTLMTNDPAAATQFIDDHRDREVVYKTFSSLPEAWRETRVLRQEEVGLLHLVRHAPVIFQEYVPAVHDLRVTVIGEQIFAAAIHSQETAYPVDSRIDIANARIEAVSLPPALEPQLLRLMRRLCLVYGAIDLRLTPDGRYVFLEINPSGQFLYIEVATGLPISAAMAAALMRLT